MDQVCPLRHLFAVDQLKGCSSQDLGFVFLRLTRAGLMQQARLAESNGYTHGSSAASKAKDELLECRLGTAAVRRILSPTPEIAE